MKIGSANVFGAGPGGSRRTVILLGSLALLAAGAAGAVLYCFPPSEFALYPRCLFHQLTGLACPGCGSLRALHRLLHGDLASAFRLNPLLLMVLPLVGLNYVAQLARRRTGRDWLAAFRHPFWIWLLLGAILVFGIGRNLPCGPLAQFRL